MSKPKKASKFIYSLASLKKVRDIREKQEKEKLTKAEQLLLDEQQKEEDIYFPQIYNNSSDRGLSEWFLFAKRAWVFFEYFVRSGEYGNNHIYFVVA